MARTITFYPGPGIPSAVHSTTLYGRHQYFGARWRALSEDLAEHFNCEADGLLIEQITWAGDERYAEFVTLDGRVLGSIDDHLTPADWREVFASRVAEFNAARAA